MKMLSALVTLLGHIKCGAGFASEQDELAQYLALFAWSLARRFMLVKIKKKVWIVQRSREDNSWKLCGA